MSRQQDITENSTGLKFKELDAGMLGRVIDDVDAAVINTVWATRVPAIQTETVQSGRKRKRGLGVCSHNQK